MKHGELSNSSVVNIVDDKKLRKRMENCCRDLCGGGKGALN